MRVALVHDWLTGMRGGERVLEALVGMFPDIEIFTLVHERGSVSRAIERRPIHTSVLNRLPVTGRTFRYALPLMPWAIGLMDVGDADLVLSSSHCVAKGVRPPAGVPHLCYCHTPMRYVWDQRHEYFGPGRASVGVRAAMAVAAPFLRRWDRASAGRADRFVANSQHVRDRIRRHYGRDAAVVHPPIDASRFRHDLEREDFYLSVGSLVPYKRTDLAVEAFRRLDRDLIVVGDGPWSGRLRDSAPGNVRFTGWLPDAAVADLMARCRALVFPGVEDFGLVPLEAQAAGAPVIALGVGGALETVRDGATGVLFRSARPDALVDAVHRFERGRFDPSAARANAVRFSHDAFRAGILREVEELMRPVSRTVRRRHGHGRPGRREMAGVRERRPRHGADRPTTPLRVAQVSAYLDPEGRSPEALLDAWPTLVDVATAADGPGVSVHVVQAAHADLDLERDGVPFHFVDALGQGPGGSGGGRSEGPFPGGPDARAIAARVAERAAALRPDVVHLQGLSFPETAAALAAALPGVPILAQDHAGRPPRPWRRRRHRRGLARLSGVAFTTAEQAEPFRAAGLLQHGLPVFEVVESSSRFRPGHRSEARRLTGIHGDPALLWIGRLNRNKDPLTVLRGLEMVARDLPHAHLWCVYAGGELEDRLTRRVGASPLLRDRVHLLGAVPHARVETLCRAADALVLGSHREGSGYALLEALACGLPPVVTDIPSFRAIAGDVGWRFPPGDASRLARSLRSLAAAPAEALRSSCRRRFEDELSFDRLGERLRAIYRSLALAALPSHGRRETRSEGAVLQATSNRR